MIDIEQDRRDVARSGGYGAAWAEAYDHVFEHGGALEAEAMGSLLSAGSHVVELGAGTGRIAIPLARAGHTVQAVEVSSAMTARLRRNLAAEDPATASRVRVVETDMAEHVEPSRSAHLVACVLGSIACLRDDTARERVVRRAAGWLAPGGHLVVETYDRATAFAEFGPEPPLVVTERSGGARLASTYRLDALAGTWSIAHRWEHGSSSAEFQEHVGFVDPAALAAWATEAGLEPVALFGDWYGTPFRAGGSPLWVAVFRRQG